MISSLPPDYLPRYTVAEINERFVHLMERCAVFLTHLTKRHPTWDLRIDPVTMKNVAQSAMDDIWRYKNYHLVDPSKFSDAVKRSSYFTKWIVKLRPIYHVRPLTAAAFKTHFDKDDSSLLVNEEFSLYISLQTLASDVGVDKISLEPDFFADILYDFHFRHLNDDALLGLYQIIKYRAQKKELVRTS